MRKIRDCGTRMYVPANTRKYVCQRPGCRTKVPQADLERIFQGELHRFALSPAEVEAIVQAIVERVTVGREESSSP